MRQADRLALRERFDFRCGYCGVHESEAGAELTVDHYQPRSLGGDDGPGNLIYCCHACNEFKGACWSAEGERRILHPQRDRVSDHLRELEDGTLVGLTPTGAFHLRRLRLNRPALVDHRRSMREQERDRQRERELERRLERLNLEIETLLAALEPLTPAEGEGSPPEK
jgi:hypothetical protein